MPGRNIYGDFDTTLKEYSIENSVCISKQEFLFYEDQHLSNGVVLN
jgi:hypothetical protein